MSVGGGGGGGEEEKKRQDKRGWAVTGEVATPLAEVAYANHTSSAILSARQGSHDRWPPTQGTEERRYIESLPLSVILYAHSRARSAEVCGGILAGSRGGVQIVSCRGCCPSPPWRGVPRLSICESG